MRNYKKTIMNLGFGIRQKRLNLQLCYLLAILVETSDVTFLNIIFLISEMEMIIMPHRDILRIKQSKTNCTMLTQVPGRL